MSALEQALKILKGGSQNDEIVSAVVMQSLASEMQIANSITSRITNKLVSDVIDEVFRIKRRHKVIHI
jgi:hypothetical protein